MCVNFLGEALSRFPVFASSISKCNTALKSFGLNIYDILSNKNTMDDITKTVVGITAVQVQVQVQILLPKLLL